MRIRASANTILAKAFYDGRSRNFTLEKYFSALATAFNDLPAAEVSNKRKMEVMLAGIQDPTLKEVKNQIVATPALNG